MTTAFCADSALTSVETLSQIRPGPITTGRKARLTPKGLYSTDTVELSPLSETATTGYSPPASMLAGSPETASVDRSNKLEEYALAGVAYYVIVDTLTQAGQPHLLLLVFLDRLTGTWHLERLYD